jgi:Cytochrome oxidase c assembly
MARAHLSVADVLHRGVVLSLIGVCVWGIGTGILVHRDTLRMGRGPRNSFPLPPSKQF